MSDYEPKLVSLPGAAVSPETLLHRTLNKLPHIKAVAVVIQWDDGSFDTDWSSMKTGDLCLASFALEDAARASAKGGAPSRSVPASS